MSQSSKSSGSPMESGRPTLDSVQPVEAWPPGLVGIGDSEPGHLTEVLFEWVLGPTETHMEARLGYPQKHHCRVLPAFYQATARAPQVWRPYCAPRIPDYRVRGRWTILPPLVYTEKQQPPHNRQMWTRPFQAARSLGPSNWTPAQLLIYQQR